MSILVLPLSISEYLGVSAICCLDELGWVSYIDRALIRTVVEAVM